MLLVSGGSVKVGGQYGVLVGDRFMVAATGDGVSIDELKAAASAVGLARLEALAKAG